MPKIIQFLHTALEAAPQSENDAFIPWNNLETHRRKFIKSPGKYVNNEGDEIDTELAFWGEWEPQSQIVKLKNSKKYLPKYLNFPFINPSVPNRTHNTDPNVFARHFKYIICKQVQRSEFCTQQLFQFICLNVGLSLEPFCVDRKGNIFETEYSKMLPAIYFNL